MADLSIGTYHVCALLTDGTAKCWGSGALGRLGDGTQLGHDTPVTVLGLENAVAIQTHVMGTCALLASGTAQCWGGGAAGVLGIGEIGFATTAKKLRW